MSKIVNIYPTMPITSVNPPIRGKLMGVRRTTADIRACIIGRARVEELLPNGKIIPLDFTNYDKDNYVKEEPKEEPKLMTAPELPAANFAAAPAPTPVMAAQPAVVDEVEPEEEQEKKDEAPEVEEEPEVVATTVAEEVPAEVVEEVEPVEEQEKKDEAPEAEVDPVRAAIEAVDTEVVEIEDDGEMEGLSDIEDVIETKDPDEVE